MESLSVFNIAIAAAMSIASALTGEGINWYLTYRHEEYKKLVSDIADSQAKVDAAREKQMIAAGSQGLTQQKVHERKIKTMEDGLKSY